MSVWFIIIALGVGSYLIRFSFIGLIGNRTLPPAVLRHLRYAAVAVLPGLVAPAVLWPAATQGQFDPPRVCAAVVTLALGYWTKNLFAAIGAGMGTLYLLQWLL